MPTWLICVGLDMDDDGYPEVCSCAAYLSDRLIDAALGDPVLCAVLISPETMRAWVKDRVDREAASAQEEEAKKAKAREYAQLRREKQATDR